MDIMKLFGRVFAPPKATEEEEVKAGSDEDVVRLRPKKASVFNGDRVSVVCRDSHRVSVCDFSVSVDGEDDEGGGGGAVYSGCGPRTTNLRRRSKPKLAAEEDREERKSSNDEEVRSQGKEEEQLTGADWENACYDVRSLAVDDDEEVSSLDISDEDGLVVVQYSTKGEIDVYDLASGERVARLEGHAYGGQCVRLSGRIVYSGSDDKTVRSWRVDDGGRNVETIYNHLDYVQTLGLLRDRWVASGGRGDHAIFVYETDRGGKLWRRHQFDQHEGWVTRLLFIGMIGKHPQPCQKNGFPSAF